MNWGGPGYGAYLGLNSTAPTVPNPGPNPASSAAPTTPGTEGGQGGTPASPTGGPNPAPPTGPQRTNDDNLRIMRERYNEYNRLGDPQVVAKQVETFNRQFTQAKQYAEALGIDAQELEEAFHSDPYATMAQLRKEYADAKRNGQREPQDINKLVQRQVQQALTPVQQQLMEQKVEKADNLLQSEVGRLFSDKELGFPDGAPDSLKELVMDYVYESLYYDEEGLKALRDQGAKAPIQKHFNDAKARLLKVLSEYGQFETKRTGNAPPDPTKSNVPDIDKKKLTPASFAQNPGLFKSVQALADKNKK